MKTKHAVTVPSTLVSLAIALGAAALMAPTAVFARESPVIMINNAAAKADIEVTPLRGGLTMLAGSGGNITVYTTPKGTLLVDAGINLSAAKLEAAVTKLGPAPIKYVINTHWHWDHTDGNIWASKSKPVIIAHPNTLRNVSKVTPVKDWDYTFQPMAKEARPNMMVDKAKTLKFGDETIKIEGFGPGHTDTDLWVKFEKANVLVLGDIFWNGVYPFIDNQNGGGINQAIAWADKAVKASKDDTIVVPGHGPVGTKADLVDFRDMLVGIRDKVAPMKKQGKTLAEVVAAKPTAKWDAKYGQFVINPDFFTRLVYEGLK